MEGMDIPSYDSADLKQTIPLWLGGTDDRTICRQFHLRDPKAEARHEYVTD